MDTDLESINGFSAGNSAAEVFIQGLAGMVNQGDVETMIRAQKQMLQRFEKTNEMLLNCNALSQSRLKTANEDFKRHVKCLGEMKKDLDYIFRKIRIIKQKLQQQYPVIYAEVQPQQQQRSSLAEEAEDETETASTSKAKATGGGGGAEGAATVAAAALLTVTEAEGGAAKAEGGAAKAEGGAAKAAAVDEGSAPATTSTKPTAASGSKKSGATIEYVQMEEAIDNGVVELENELIKRVCSVEIANPNDSSDCTSEDTG
ncbi:kxDL motif-containing protein CG10681 [Drosophila willistoni]|uniref:kxDL motif-containing protein CG10681 n=1 Tax=Drosophila willistoni TaxID=7260 RepID=UPI00017D7FC0|nr:kxDL motif-containing protein CG10681 [Drosophila willistoni]